MIFTRHFDPDSLPITKNVLLAAVEGTNRYLVDLPKFFRSGGTEFYAVLNQRNLSGFIGEILKHAICSLDMRFVQNPHSDGRPDVLDLGDDCVRHYFRSECFDKVSGAPIRDKLAPFRYGGVEIKCTIGICQQAGERPIGIPRISAVTGLTYWAHHAHECNLLGVYYDYCPRAEHNPQIKAIFFADILQTDWNKVSTGDPKKKKTSNTALRSSGLRKLYDSLVVYEDSEEVHNMLRRLRVRVA